MRRIRFLIWKELIELRQDPRLFAIVVMAPILQLFMLAYAATTDVRDVPIVIADADRSTASRDLVSRFDASPSFTITKVVSSPDAVDTALERGDAWLAIVVPRGYGAALDTGQSQAVQIIADGSDANSAGVSMSYATSLIASYGQVSSHRMVRRSPRAPRWERAGLAGPLPVGLMGRRPPSSRWSVCGSTRGSKAATS
jgi:ABC-2 type transport system permease protein